MEKHRPSQPRGIQTVDDLASCKPTIDGINPNISDQLDLILHHNLYTPPRKKGKERSFVNSKSWCHPKTSAFHCFWGNISLPLCFLSPFIFIWWYQGILRRVILSIALLPDKKWLTLSACAEAEFPFCYQRQYLLLVLSMYILWYIYLIFADIIYNI